MKLKKGAETWKFVSIKWNNLHHSLRLNYRTKLTITRRQTIDENYEPLKSCSGMIVNSLPDDQRYIKNSFSGKLNKNLENSKESVTEPLMERFPCLSRNLS